MTGDPIEEYLDALFVELRGRPAREARSLLAETEEHLRDLADAAHREGLDELTAGRRAVAEYGDPSVIAAADRRRITTPLLVRIGISGWQLGAIGAVAVGVSGIVAALAHAFGASDATLAGSSATGLAPADCARWRSLDPKAITCAQAALHDWTAETIFYRIALGIVGLLALFALATIRRRSTRARLARPLPATVSDAIATTAFGAAGIWLTAIGIDAMAVRSGAGAGFWLTAAPVALALTAYYGRRLIHDIGDPVEAC